MEGQEAESISHCFHVLAIANSASTNTGVHVSFLIIFFLWIRAQEWDCRNNVICSNMDGPRGVILNEVNPRNIV